MPSVLPAFAASAAGDIPNWFAVVMGIGTVFAGLIAIIVICLITGAFAGTAKKEKPKPAVKSTVKHEGDPRVRQELIAAVSAACAEEMGTAPEKLRVISFKKIN
ncbi:MAG: OadG family protein [Clostridia bacterium]|nr:OadG family protein [Clostridia bacterium]